MNLNHLKRVAQMSTHQRYNHCTLLFGGSRLLSVGYNTGNIHSEIMALKRLDQVLRNHNSPRPNNLHIINAMFKTMSGNMGNSFPCRQCVIALRDAGIKRVTWFGSDGIAYQVGGLNWILHTTRNFQ